MIEPTENDIYLILRDDYIKLDHMQNELSDDIYKNFKSVAEANTWGLEDDLSIYVNRYYYAEYARLGVQTGFRMICGLFDTGNIVKLTFQFDFTSLELDQILSKSKLKREYPVIDLNTSNGCRLITLSRQEYPIYGVKMPTEYITNDWQKFVQESMNNVYPVLQGVLDHNISTDGIDKARSYLKRYEIALNRKYPYWLELERFKPC